jgi:hypothetical protein
MRYKASLEIKKKIRYLKMDISVGDVVLPNKPLSNFELMEAAKMLSIPKFSGVFLRNTLPKRPAKKECGILNLDDTSGSGTHWVAWLRNGGSKYYFDSYGLQPPLELIDYLGSPIHYNTEEIQPRGQVFCGHLCLYVLKQMTSGKGLQ